MADENNTPIDPIEKNIDLAIEAQDGKAPETSDTETPSGEQNKEPSGTEQQPENSGSGDSNTTTQQPSENKTGEKVQQQTHAPKDLTLADGTVVKGGAERRFYEQRENARQQLASEQRAHNELQTKYNTLEKNYNDLDNQVKALHGIDAKTVQLGVNIVRDLQRDPSGTMKKLLAEVTAQGYSVDEIGQGVDVAAIEARILTALRQDQSTKPDEDQLTREALNEANQFFANHPDAKPHDAFLARMLRDHPDLSLQDAYYQLRDAFAEKGFDWSLSVDDNIKALESSGQNATGEKTPQPTPNEKAPLPNGGNATNVDIKTADVFEAGADDMDTSDIVRAAMRESGLNI